LSQVKMVYKKMARQNEPFNPLIHLTPSNTFSINHTYKKYLSPFSNRSFYIKPAQNNYLFVFAASAIYYWCSLQNFLQHQAVQLQCLCPSPIHLYKDHSTTMHVAFQL